MAGDPGNPRGLTVRAVVLTAGEEARAGLERQTRRPDEVVAGDGAALDCPADWLWLLDGSVEPAPNALEQLLEALERLAPVAEPVLLAGRVVAPDRSPDPGWIAIPDVRDLDFAIAAVECNVVSLRVAPRGSLLVRTSAVAAVGPPGPDDAQWTARLLRDRPGVLVPASVAVRRASPDTGPRYADRLKLLAGDSLRRAEKPWFAFRLIEDALVGAAAARRGGRAGSRQRSPC